jgi:hypothetical protein
MLSIPYAQTPFQTRAFDINGTESNAFTIFTKSRDNLVHQKGRCQDFVVPRFGPATAESGACLSHLWGSKCLCRID